MAQQEPLPEKELIKEVCRRIRVARSYWDAHNNRACRGERERALSLYNTLTKEQKDQIPQELRVWLRYRSEKYFGAHQTPPKSKRVKRSPK
ncbi:MAG: Precorrin-3B methylase [Leptolyngbyaceae cyanobacterium RM2_2_4]|nr:Precorrin-3B methylase [Leptolyngbyaceae cyanobacterium SM1_4_3]NJN91921.1 Precorrin-3B methylase [Leptolyngbyaceae cyanobacterium SL_5_14]NJO51618.1 Precorrin-3B methylase [Leptolyngbyaceae cyanobacterium RM2_2_4]NJO66324.1 Precorrin-3B methylase [Leptolyngbyaceae cyanobacterium RM1_405_57]